MHSEVVTSTSTTITGKVTTTKSTRVPMLPTTWCRGRLEELTGSQLVKYSPHFMKPESSLPRSQVSAICPYPEPDRSSPHSHKPLPEVTKMSFSQKHNNIFNSVTYATTLSPLFVQLMHENYYKIVKQLKSFKIIIAVPTCFDLRKPSSGSSQPVLR